MIIFFLIVSLFHVTVVKSAPVSAGSSRSSTGGSAAYSLSLTTFDPSGRLQQLEHAYRCVDGAWPCCAYVCDDGLVVAKWAAHVEGASKQCLQICRVSDRLCLTYAGLKSDFRALTKKCRELAVDYVRDFDTEPSVCYLADAMSSILQEHTQRGGLRPFGCTLILAGVDDDDTSLKIYTIEPSGWSAPFYSAAIGLDAKKLQDQLRGKVDDVIKVLKNFEIDSTSHFEATKRTDHKGNVLSERPSLQCSLAIISLVDESPHIRLYADIQDYYSETTTQ